MGDVGSLSNRDPSAKVEEFLDHLALYLTRAENIRLIFPGRSGTISEKLVLKMQDLIGEAAIASKVQTYLPENPSEAEIPESDYVTYGAVIHAGMYPEQRREAMVRDADAVLLMGTGRGIYEVHKIAKKECRFIIPVPMAAGPATEEYASQIRQHTISSGETYNSLAKIGSGQLSGEKIANAVVDLLEKFGNGRIGNSQVFLAMPFIKEFKERIVAEQVAREICAALNLNLYIAKDTTGEKPLITLILENIEISAVLIAYMDCGRPNVYLEAGYAWGKGKPVILCVKEGSNTAFDVNSHEQIRWKDAGELKRRMTKRLELLISERRVITSG